MFKKKIAALLLAALILCAGCHMLWANTALMTEEYAVTSAKLPASCEGLRIVHISDLHNTSFGDGNEKLLSRIENLQPDLIAVTGDLIDSRRTDLDVAIHFARKAAKIAPTFYVPGNHESRNDETYGTLKTALAEAGVTILENRTQPFSKGGDAIMLAGLLDPLFYQTSTLLDETEAMTGAILQNLLTDDASFYLLLAHRPDLFEVYASSNADLVLSGHAHGGQFRLPLLGGLYTPDQGLFPQYDAGLFEKNNTTMIISRGLGNSVVPLRINNRPVVILITLQTERKSHTNG